MCAGAQPMPTSGELQRRSGLALLTLCAVLASGSALVASPAVRATERDPDPRVVIDGVRQTDLEQIPYTVDGFALDVRRAAANGINAPQIGLEARYGKKELQRWREAQRKYPKWTEPFAPCVEKFELAIEEIRRIAPLTRRPAWDTSVDEINAGLRQARNLVGVGDSCMEDGRYAFNSMASRAKAGNDRRVLEGRIAHDEQQNDPNGGYQRDPNIPEWSPPADGGPRWPGGIDPTQPFDEKRFLERCIGVGRQYKLQKRIHAADSMRCR